MAETAPQESQQQPAQPRTVNGTTATPPSWDQTPQERFAAQQAEAGRRDPWLSDPTKTTLERDARSGNLIAKDRATGRALNPDTGAVEPPKPGESEAPAEGERRVKIGEVEFSEKEWLDLASAKAVEDIRKAQIPAEPTGYKLELPKDLKLPPGVDFKVASLDDPVKGPGLRAALEWAHRSQFSQGQVSEMLGVYAAAQSMEQAQINVIANKERDKLGAAGPVRIAAIETWLRGNYGEDARPMVATLVSEKQVRIFENIIQKLTNQGGGNYSGRHREIESKTIDDATWDKMTYTEKKDYAERHQTNGAAR